MHIHQHIVSDFLWAVYTQYENYCKGYNINPFLAW